MSFANEASKLLNNKYFLYLMVFLTITNMLGYLVTNKLNAVIFFALISLLAYQFSKNMSIILLIALIATNFMMSQHLMREGMTIATDTAAIPVVEDTEIDKAGDNEINDAASVLKKSLNVTDAKNTLNTLNTNAKSQENVSKTIDTNNPSLNSGDGTAELEGAGKSANAKTGFQNANRQQIGAPITNTDSLKGPRLDYASTMEAAYDNLDKMLGGDGIKQLTNDTQKLMSQQQQLFDTMNQMGPMLESAQGLLKGFDFKSLGNLSSLASSLGGASTVNTASS
jgi:hypothetical protein